MPSYSWRMNPQQQPQGRTAVHRQTNKTALQEDRQTDLGAQSRGSLEEAIKIADMEAIQRVSTGE